MLNLFDYLFYKRERVAAESLMDSQLGQGAQIFCLFLQNLVSANSLFFSRIE